MVKKEINFKIFDVLNGCDGIVNGSNTVDVTHQKYNEAGGSGATETALPPPPHKRHITFYHTSTVPCHTKRMRLL